MYVAIGIGTLLLGGWVLRAPVNDQELTVPIPLEESVIPYPSFHGAMPQGNQTSPMDRSRTRNRMLPERRRSDMSTLSTQRQLRQQGGGAMPMAPTESAQADAQGTSGLPLPPTGQSTPDESAPRGAADQAYGSGGMGMPRAPTYRRSPSPQRGGGGYTSRSYGAVQQRFDRTQVPTQPPRAKAFSSYRPPTSGGVSPYMNLFRTDTSRGTIDNYTTLVRPALEQQNMNQQFRIDIFGLERNARIQNSALQRLNRGNTRSLQSVGTPQYYRNYGGYYPASGQ